MKAAALVLLLSGCATDAGSYVMWGGSPHGPLIMGKFASEAACEKAWLGSDPGLMIGVRCTTERQFQREQSD